MIDVIALLDRPSRQSMGAVPFVSANMMVHGLSGSPSRPIDEDDLQELLQTHQATRLDRPTSIEPPSPVANLVAMWIGRDFDASATTLEVPAPPLPSEDAIETSDGRAAVGNVAEAYARLEAWLERAFRRVVAHPDERLARLMTQVMPDHDLTQAALWYSATSERQRSQELDWFLRLRRDAGKAASIRSLERHFRHLCEHPPWTNLRTVVLVSGLAGTRHREVARQLTEAVGEHLHGSSMVSFGDFLRRRWEELYGRPATKPDLQRFGQEQVDAGPFLFVQQVLAQTRARAPLLVVDGVRHEVIKEAIKFIVHRPTIVLGVQTPEELIIKHLRDELAGVGADISRVRAAQTENEAKKLLEHVSQRIDYTDSDAENQRQVEQASQLALRKAAAAG